MDHLNKTLAEIKAKGRTRVLTLPLGIDLTSNDYLGLSKHPALVRAAINAFENGIPVGAAGSRLLRGHTPSHNELELFAATHFFAPKTLFFSCGFQANYALFTTLPDRHDVILYDALIHASARDGIKASTAKSFKFPHNDPSALEALLKANHGKTIWIAIETIYSMDGDYAPLEQIYALAKRYNAILIADEAHSTGLYGPDGKGLCWQIIEKDGYRNLITLHTCGKAIGVAGGLVCADTEIIDYLINCARAFIFTTAPMPIQALLVLESLKLIASAEGQNRREKLRHLCKIGQSLFGGSGTPVIPIILGTDDRATATAAKLQVKGYDIRAVRPPTVPEGQSRLRLSLSCDLSENILQDFAVALKEVTGGIQS